MDWFSNAKLGVFIHWGIYCVPAFDSPYCAQMRKIQNGSEWYLGRLTKTHRQSYSDKLTIEYHKKHYGDMDYYDFASMLNGSKFDADEWCKLFKSVGAKYIVFTAKHHDGFCMWNTKTTKHNITNTPLKRDVTKELRESAIKHGLKFGIYYSWMEFNKGATDSYIKTIVKPQLLELMTYKPDLWWMDGDWIATADKWQSDKFVEAIHKRGAIINSRLGSSSPLRGKGTKGGDYDNFSDRFIPDKKMDKIFESCWTIGLSWGYNKQQKIGDYKTSEKLFEIYNEVTSKNGNLLLNIAPDSNGEFDKIEKERLIGLGKLINGK
jgi:alpha-L-fucosidase